jgi:uncharacterized membrane protein (DUF485 family)
VIRLYTWWHGSTRQKRTGWTLLIVALGYLIYFLKARLFEIGPEITRREWFNVAVMLILIVIGTINIRMAEMKERNQKTLPLIDPNQHRRK